MFLSIRPILLMERCSDPETISNIFHFILIYMHLLIEGSGEAKCPNLHKLNIYVIELHGTHISSKLGLIIHNVVSLLFSY